MNKLGFYIQNSQGTHDPITHIQPPVILIHAWDQGLLEDIRRFRAPDAFVIGRMDYIGLGGNKTPITQSLINSWLDGPDPAARGRELAEHILMDNFQLAQRKGANGRPLVDAWMSLNECIPGPASGAYNNSQTERDEIERRLRAYDKFQAAFRSKLMEQGIEAVAFNFGAGNFTRAAHYLDFFPETLASYTYLGFHEYGWPAMRPDPAAGIYSSAGSYRPILQTIRQKTGRELKAVITEAGLARMFKHSTDGVGDVGWLYENDWISQDAYFASLDWYNDYLVGDAFAVGACLFQVGVGAGWQTFRHSGQDVQGNPIQILDRVRQLQDKTDHQPQPTVGEEDPQPEEPQPEKPPVENPEEPPSRPPHLGGSYTVFLPGVGIPANLPNHLPIAQKVGLDCNRPIDPVTGAAAPQVDDPDIVAQTGVGWVRLNFVLGQAWPSVNEAGWQERYRQIVAGFRSRGLKIYGLISDEALDAPPGDQYRDAPPDGAGPDGWISRYVESFVTIVRLFHQDVSLFESYNEPDDYHGGGRNWIHPGWFAVMLQALYTQVKGDPTLRHVTLVSGPLQGLHNDDLNHNNNAAARYLRSTYQEGKQRFGWGSRTPFPFDGVGYHLYVAQSPVHSDAQITAKYKEYISGLAGVIRDEEGQAKPIYLSEYGWFSNNGNEDFQERAMATGLKIAADDPALALVIWFCTQDFGAESDFKFYGLYRKGPITPENRKTGVYRCFQQMVTAPRQVPIAIPGSATLPAPDDKPVLEARIPVIYTNQQAIDAAYNAATQLNLSDVWALLVKAGQDVGVLAQNRQNRYGGPALDETPSFTNAERVLVRRELLEQLTLTMRWEGLVTASDGLSLRTGPGTDQPRLRILAHEEKLQVLDDTGPWLFVLADETPGFCSAQWVMRVIAPTPQPPAPTEREQALLRAWNRHGQLLSEESARLGIDPAVTVAVLLAESGGDGFGPDGRLKIRFENHIFLQQWGQQNKAVFDRFFRFNDKEQWKEHQWRKSENDPWQNCHQSQAQEWEVLSFARNFIEDPALKATSMGAAQIMGFNFATVGYDSPGARLTDFQSGEEAQVRALFRYIENRRLVEPLRQGDFVAFARGFNGPGQQEFYARLIQEYIAIFVRLIGTRTAIREMAALAGGSRGVAAPLSTADDTLWRSQVEARLQKLEDTPSRSGGPGERAGWFLLAVAGLAFVAGLILALLTRSQPVAAVSLAYLFGTLSVVALLVYGLNRRE